MQFNTPQEALNYYVTGAIERGEAEAIAGIDVVVPDYHNTGKLYKKLDAFKRGPDSRGIGTLWGYFGSSVQFKTCKRFKAYLEQKYPGEKFRVCKAR